MEHIAIAATWDQEAADRTVSFRAMSHLQVHASTWRPHTVPTLPQQLPIQVSHESINVK